MLLIYKTYKSNNLLSKQKMSSTDAREICKRIVKYVLQGLVLAFAAIVLPKKTPDLEEAFTLAVIAAAVFAILDILAPNSGLGEAARQGAGLGLGFQLVRFP